MRHGLFFGSQAEMPEEILRAVQARVKSLRRVEYDVKRVYNYPSEQYHAERGGRLHQDYTHTENRARLRYHLDDNEWLSVYNGTDLFDCNKKSRTLALTKSVSEERVISSGGFQHSLYMLREGLGALVGDKNIQCRVLPGSNKNLAVVDVQLTKCALDGFGRVQPGNYDQQLEFTFDRKSLLPVQIIQRFPKDGTITNTYSNYRLNPGALRASNYYYSNYLKTYSLEIPKTLKNLEVGAPAPDWTLEKADGSGKLSLQDLRGKYVVLDFFIVYCGPCIESVPKLNRWQKEYPHVAFVSLNIGDTRELVNGFIKRNNLQLPTVLGQEKLAEAYGLAGYPRLFLLSPEGKVLNNGLAGSEAVERLLRTIR
jgi:thiol-disulfide isomerase/thioredoxin/outer membrane lipoprotein-sorting protein